MSHNRRKALSGGKPRKAGISKEKAAAILEPLPAEKAFYFYTAIGKPTGKAAYSFAEFVQLINETDPVGIQFHLSRGDFEKWVNMLGYDELSKELGMLRGEKLSIEILHRRLVTILSTNLANLREAR